MNLDMEYAILTPIDVPKHSHTQCDFCAILAAESIHQNQVLAALPQAEIISHLFWRGFITAAIECAQTLPTRGPASR